MANETTSSGDAVMADDVPEPLKVSDDVDVAEMTELDSCNADNLSVIAVDNATLVPGVGTTSECDASNDNEVIASPAAVSDTVECSAAQPIIGIQSEIVTSSPSKLVIDTSTDAADDSCSVQKDQVENVGNVDADSVAVCETVDKIGCDAIVTESLPLSSDSPVTFPALPTNLGEVILGDDAVDPGGMQLDVAECVEIGDTAD